MNLDREVPTVFSTNLGLRECLGYVDDKDGRAASHHNAIPCFVWSFLATSGQKIVRRKTGFPIEELVGNIRTAIRKYANQHPLDTCRGYVLWLATFQVG
jgi:hypothetical protein